MIKLIDISSLEKRLIEDMEKEYEKRSKLGLEKEKIMNQKIIESKKPLTNLFGNCPYCGNRLYYPVSKKEYYKKCSECKRVYH